jgi:hypothetical protein
MKGWRRIGAVLSVLWFVGFGGWIWHTSVNNNVEFYEWQLRNCNTLSGMRREPIQWDDPQRDQKYARIEEQDKACTDKASAFFGQQMDTLKSHSHIWVLVAVDAGLLALFWLLAWIVVCVGRWVAAGFRQQRAG